MSLSDEFRDSPHRLAYYERTLNRIASEVGGNAKFQAERIAGIMDEIDGLRKEIAALREAILTAVRRVDRMAEFLNKLKEKGVDANGKKD